MTDGEPRNRKALGLPVVDSASVRRAVGVDPGLCGSCRWARLVTSKSSSFVRCGASDDHPGLLRYPPLPVLECPAFEAREAP